MAEAVFDPINVETNIIVDVVTDVKVDVTTNVELNQIINESVEEPIHFMAKIEKVPTEKVREFITFSFSNYSKARVTKTSYDMEGRKLEAIIPQKLFEVSPDLVPNGS